MLAIIRQLEVGVEGLCWEFNWRCGGEVAEVVVKEWFCQMSRVNFNRLSTVWGGKKFPEFDSDFRTPKSNSHSEYSGSRVEVYCFCSKATRRYCARPVKEYHSIEVCVRIQHVAS